MKFFFYLAFAFHLGIFSQTKDLVVLNSETSEGLDLVNVFYPKLNEGSITNASGKVRIELRKDSLTFSHINYSSSRVSYENLSTIDTIYLVPKENTLSEVIVTNFDLKKKLRTTFENYSKYYPTLAITNESTYKEVYRTNNKLARLIQVQLKWWHKDYKYNFKKNLNKQSEFSLVEIDYSKISNDSTLSKAGFIENKSLVPTFHLNYYILYLLDYCNEIYIDKLIKNENSTKVIFTSDVFDNNEKIASLNKSELIFDEKGAIIYLKFILDYNNFSYEEYSERKRTKYTGQTQRQIMELNFKQINNSIYNLSSYKSQLLGTISYSGNTDSFDIRQELFITKSYKSKSIKNSEIIDLEKPFYENITSYKNLENKILLTSEELEFINDSINK
ncbi:hypothetical protein EJ994_14185 [Maribacter sp. MJ134]|uniref:hypothetical protein n=1 Tax=Maribacter sp. MJ134 TaxID=2496865 RepID=UPI000F82186F|nr:hypothetical protein [Maribacter sp. MJ134]AZQ59889.1 hypothetical protein EJ994_14185 [Maribacter sp. MJ134]